GHRDLADLHHAAVKAGAEFLVQPLLGHGTRGHGGRGETGRRTPAAARITDAVFLPVGVVGVAGAEGARDLAVVLAALVGVADQQADRRAGGLALVHAAQDLHRVGLVALGDELAGAGAAAVQVALDVGLTERHAGRAAVDDAADGRAVGFAEVGDPEQGAEGVAAHATDYR